MDRNFGQFANRLREERKRIGITQADCALAVGVARVTWGTYERAEYMPGADVLVLLIGLGFDVNYILGGGRVLSDESTLSDGERTLIECYRATDADGKRAMERMGRMEAERMKPRRKAG